MLGFTARALDPKLTVNTDELETADWFTFEALQAHPEMLPHPTSIAYRLIVDWMIAQQSDAYGR
jgi:NADH pyrophosphatase NudC (nudix superfamily)